MCQNFVIKSTSDLRDEDPGEHGRRRRQVLRPRDRLVELGHGRLSGQQPDQ